MGQLKTLPPEILLEITSHLPPLSKHFLSLTSRYLYTITGQVELSKSDTYDLRLQREHFDPSRYHRVCSKCVRLLQFYHFSVKHSSAKVKSVNRTCLDSFLKAHDHCNKKLTRWFFGINFGVCTSCHQLVRCPGYMGPTDTKIFNMSSCILPHTRRLGTDPERKVGAGVEPSINRMRDTLDQLEDRLPPKHLLAYRPDTYRNTLTLEAKFEEAIALLQERAAREAGKRKRR